MPTMKDMNSAGGCELLALKKAPAASDDAKKHQHAMADLEWRALKAEMARDRAYAEIAAKDQAIAELLEKLNGKDVTITCLTTERDRLKENIELAEDAISTALAQIAELQHENAQISKALQRSRAQTLALQGSPAPIVRDLPPPRPGSVWERMGEMLAEKQAAQDAKMQMIIETSGLFRSNPIHAQLVGKVAPAKLHQFNDIDNRCDQCGRSRQDVITSPEMHCNGQSAEKS